jgi:truncated hemoglobin YjbI
VFLLAILLVNAAFTYVVVRTVVKGLLDEERDRWLRELRRACSESAEA